MSMLGTNVVRKEDPVLLTAGGTYVDDLVVPDALHVVFVRCSVAHAAITSIDTAEALAMPGVVGVFTAADLELTATPPGMPMFNKNMLRTRLASDRVRFVGEPVAAVVTEPAATTPSTSRSSACACTRAAARAKTTPAGPTSPSRRASG